MDPKRGVWAALAAAALLVCAPGGSARADRGEAASVRKVTVTIESADGATHRFEAEVARNTADQERGLMFRTNLDDDDAMLFAPYPPEGGPPREAHFWMRNTPTALDIIFIRPDRSIARIVANAVPFSEESLGSGEPVGAILEVRAGRTKALGIVVGDKVSW